MPHPILFADEPWFEGTAIWGNWLMYDWDYAFYDKEFFYA